MKIYKNPDNLHLKALLERPKSQHTFEKEQLVATILDTVKQKGDSALFDYSKKFDSVVLQNLAVSADELSSAEAKVSKALIEAIKQAYKNIYTFHEAQQESPKVVETMPGISCWRKSVAIDKVGLYIPGGTAPLFSTVLMLGIPAKIAGCKSVVMCTPPNKNGEIAPEILYTAQLLGIINIFKIGGAQAIAAMAFGTESIPQVYKIFGPGNSYVTLAKTLVQKEGVAIDMPAGPSELMVVCDATANAGFVASDLLSQAEHGVDSQVVLVCTDCDFIKDVQLQLAVQIAVLPRQAIAEKALENSKLVFVDTKEQVISIANYYAPEHLIVCGKDEQFYVDNIQNAGSVFIGDYTPESAGDYASGTNHTLPTSGFAKVSGGVSLDAFVKKITFQKLSAKGLQNIGKTVEIMAEAEGLEAHKNAVTLRLNSLK